MAHVCLPWSPCYFWASLPCRPASKRKTTRLQTIACSRRLKLLQASPPFPIDQGARGIPVKPLLTGCPPNVWCLTGEVPVHPAFLNHQKANCQLVNAPDCHKAGDEIRRSIVKHWCIVLGLLHLPIVRRWFLQRPYRFCQSSERITEHFWTRTRKRNAVQHGRHTRSHL